MTSSGNSEELTLPAFLGAVFIHVGASVSVYIVGSDQLVIRVCTVYSTHTNTRQQLRGGGATEARDSPTEALKGATEALNS